MSGATKGGVRYVLRLEGLCVLIIALILYSKLGLGWGTFALYFLVPDISFIGFLAGSKIGALSYNLAHSYIGPMVLLGVGYTSVPALYYAGLIWIAHIGFDRAMGYGLKYSDGFSLTHLGLIGNQNRNRKFIRA
jgi:hypothetical protein